MPVSHIQHSFQSGDDHDHMKRKGGWSRQRPALPKVGGLTEGDRPRFSWCVATAHREGGKHLHKWRDSKIARSDFASHTGNAEIYENASKTVTKCQTMWLCQGCKCAGHEHV